MQLDATQLTTINQTRLSKGLEELTLSQANTAAATIEDDKCMDALTGGLFNPAGQYLGMAPEPKVEEPPKVEAAPEPNPIPAALSKEPEEPEEDDEPSKPVRKKK